MVEVGLAEEVANGDGVAVLKGVFDKAFALEDVDVFLLVLHEEDFFGATHLGGEEEGGRNQRRVTCDTQERTGPRPNP